MEQYFTDDELRCKCCEKLVIDLDFRTRLNNARALAGFAFVVTSGYRCEQHNQAVGSTSTNHVLGKAADIKCTNGWTRYAIVRAMIEANMMGIGIGNYFIHCDTNRTDHAIWTY